VWGQELYFDATKRSRPTPRQRIDRPPLRRRAASTGSFRDLFEEDPQEEDPAGALGDAAGAAVGDVDALPTSEDAELAATNAAKSDWISRAGSQEREVKGNFYRRKADLFLSKTDPDAPRP
jgi:hypothetical protein